MKKITNTEREMNENPAEWGTRFLLDHMIGLSPIERSEAQGQAELVESEFLPPPTAREREAFERLGFVFGGPVDGDPLFVHATLPEGWTKKACDDHAMWSFVYDKKGRKRASIFYKAAFYDRRADMHLEARWAIEPVSEGGVVSEIRVVDRQEDKILFVQKYRSDFRASSDDDPTDWAVCVLWMKDNLPPDEMMRGWDDA